MRSTLLAITVFLSIGALSLSAADWPLFRGNSLQTGVAPVPLPDKLEIRWRFEAKDGFEGAAAIDQGTVYIGSMDEHLYALDLDSGKVKWIYPSDKEQGLKVGPFKAPVSYHDGAIYVGDADGMFHCVDAQTGKKRWTYNTESEISSGANFTNDAVIFGSGDEQLHCLTLDGKEKWKFRVPGGPVLGTPAIVDGFTFAAGCDSTLHVIDTATGKEKGMGVDLGGQVGATVAVIGDRLYVGTMSNQVLGIDWKKGEVLWRYEAANRKQAFYASAAATDRLIVTGSRDKRVHAINRKTGEAAWSFSTGGRVDSSPVVAGSRVYIGSQDDKLYVLELGTGRELQRLDLGSPIVASPAVAGDCLVIGTDKGVVYALGKKR